MNNKRYSKIKFLLNKYINNLKFEVSIPRSKKVVIAHNASFRGNVEACSLEIFGEVRGNIEVNKLWINSTGKLIYHKANYVKMVKDEGAKVSPAIIKEKKNKSINIKKHDDLPTLSEIKDNISPENAAVNEKTIFYQSI